MAKALRNDLQVDPLRQEHCASAVSEVVEADSRQTSLYQKWLESTATEATSLYGSTDFVYEDEVAVLPSWSLKKPLGRLVDTMSAEGIFGDGAQEDMPPAACGLGLCDC